MLIFFFFFNDTATTEIYTLSLHDALPIWVHGRGGSGRGCRGRRDRGGREHGDRKRPRLNSSHSQKSYAVFRLKKKKKELYLWARARTCCRLTYACQQRESITLWHVQSLRR